MNSKSNTECLTPGCGKKSLTRGLCRSHYSYLAALIRSKKAPSFKALEKQGKVLPPKPSGGGIRGAGNFGKWVNS